MKPLTSQRRAIQRVLLEAGRPLSPTEIRIAAGKLIPRLGQATVYRTLKRLVAEARLTVVGVPGESPRYEISGKPHHHHFLCRSCGRLYEVDGCPGGLPAITPPGFELERHEVTLVGRCSSCL